MSVRMLLASPFGLSILGLLVCMCVMALAWVWAMKRAFLSVVDAVWAYGIGGLAILYGVLSADLRLEKVAPLAVGAFWSVRLGSHLAHRLWRHFPKEDRRYDDLRAAWQSGLRLKSFLFFQFQALTQSFFAFPFACVALSADPAPVPIWVGIALALVGLVGEVTADSQLRRFVAEPSHRGEVCNVGLWRYSRHPNYFFEWVVWLGFGAIGFFSSVTTAQALLCAACPLVMLVLLLFVTGVPPAEASSIKSKGTLYRDYQSRTSRFVPWFPRRRAHTQETA